MKNLIKHLRLLGNDNINPVDSCCGICKEVYVEMPKLDVTAKLIQHPDYSGRSRFPIRDPLKKRNASTIYLTTPNKWNIHTPYGKARRDMCLWLADEYEKDLQEVPDEDNQK